MTSSFFRDDARTLEGLEPIDRNDPASQHTATEYSLPYRFSKKAKACWEYLARAAYIFEYKGRLVMTDESLYLTDHGDGSHEAPFGGPRGTFDSWDEVEEWLEGLHDSLREDGQA